MKKHDFNISIEEFDAPFEVHEFSERYKKEKERNMRNFRNKNSANKTAVTRIAVAAAALVVASPFVVNAATNGEFFQRVWGTLGRNDVESHVEYIEDKGREIPIVYPQQDFVDVNPEVAEDMIGDYVTHTDIVKEVDGTTITILTAIRDANACVVEFTLEKEGGVDCLNYSQNDNESKGAWFTDESTFYFNVGEYGKIYVDLEKSTPEKLYCYCYSYIEGGIWLEIFDYPCTLGERQQYANEDNTAELSRIDSEMETYTISIPCESRVESVQFVNSEGGTLDISPLSMVFDMSTGFGFDHAQSQDPGSIYYVRIDYADGTSYLVDERNNLEHSCDVETANYSYTIGMSTDMYYFFNRLVDTNEVSSITINGVEYTR